ncbi:spermidine/putrescine ABC transporter ATPase subunit [Parasphaerochaeta coccoides DSM 17374]|uniref:Spermidine/putrescine import ATP-binding protein PotA n=1 Tax=Parasphaerochaeta coccoides (strain ATCC BAA-1237 / DSM 17374 / SPN1) TaxID=760011 RepID=F4GHV8_PARC1|nr:spermidine/putrescine ABC transporter ATPase subunit [Parasphaerochaeta coccoides DSM 17374]
MGGKGKRLNGVEVTARGVTRKFGDFLALDDVSVDIKKGEFFSLLGPSGCGKTTLLRIIAGFDSPDVGFVSFDGADILPLPPEKRQANTIFQTYALFPHLNVYENVAFPLRIRRRPKDEIDRRVRDYIHLVQLDEHITKKPSMLSGGQKQRVAIARALINEPKVLLLDEPLSALDAKLRQNLLIELDEIHDKVGITFIYVTHDQSEALSVSDRIAVMNHGKVLQIGTPYEIYEAPATEFVARFIGETNIFPCTVLSCNPTSDGEFMLNLDVPALGGTIRVTDVDPQEIGKRLDFTIRPEKIRITTDVPEKPGKDINQFLGIVDEPVYAGFQSKFFVKLTNGAMIKVYKQHVNYMDDGPEIEWKDSVYVSWSAADGYLVKVVDA